MPNFFFKEDTTAEAIKTNLKMGQLTNTSVGVEKTIFIYHDSLTDLENCGFFVQPYAGKAYSGQYGESFDYLNLLDWGTNAGKGLRINQSQSTDTSYDKAFFFDGVNGSGASYENFIPLDTAAILGGLSTSEGLFPAGATAKVVLKLAVPVTETSPGKRDYSIFLHFEE